MEIAILGAHGKIAQLVTKKLVKDPVTQRLFLRNTARLTAPQNGRLIEGDAENLEQVKEAIEGATIVYANLAGKTIENQAKTIVEAMKETGVKRLIWVSTLGIYDEVPGNFGIWNHQMLDGGYLETYSKAAELIENSGLDYTILRPAWLTNKTEVSYELTQKGAPFKGTEVSRESVADFIRQLILHPESHQKESLGINKPNTDGDKPAWY